MLQSVLEFFGNMAEMHVLSASCRTFDLQTVAVEHVEAEEGLDEKEVDASGVHGELRTRIRDVREQGMWALRGPYSQIGPRQFEFPPNMPESLSPETYSTRKDWPLTSIL